MMIVRVATQFIERCRPRYKAHEVVTSDMERGKSRRFGELWRRMMQLSDVINLVKPVNDGFVVDRDIPFNDFMKNHVFHLECAEVA